MPKFMKGSWTIKVGAFFIFAVGDWIVGQILNSVSSTVAKMPDIDKLSWSVAVFLLLVGIPILFARNREMDS